MGTSAPGGSGEDDADSLTLMDEPVPRVGRKWGRRGFKAREAVAGTADTGGRALPAADRDRAGSLVPYDFTKEPEPDFVDLTGESATGWMRADAARPRRKRTLKRVLVVLVACGVVACAAAAVALRPSGQQTGGTLAVEVPDLAGRPVSEAEALAARNGWTVEKSEDRAEGSVQGQVLSQRPAPGAKLGSGGTLSLRVSVGAPLAQVPADLRGKPLNDARTALFFAGFGVGEIQRQPSEDLPADTVISVREGTPASLPKGSAVPLVVSSGRPGEPVTSGSAPSRPRQTTTTKKR